VSGEFGNGVLLENEMIKLSNDFLLSGIQKKDEFGKVKESISAYRSTEFSVDEADKQSLIKKKQRQKFESHINNSESKWLNEAAYSHLKNNPASRYGCITTLDFKENMNQSRPSNMCMSADQAEGQTTCVCADQAGGPTRPNFKYDQFELQKFDANPEKFVRRTD